MVLLAFVWKCFQDRNFHGVVEQSIESWVRLALALPGYLTLVGVCHARQPTQTCTPPVFWEPVPIFNSPVSLWYGVVHSKSCVQCPASSVRSVTAKVLKIMSPDFISIFVMCAVCGDRSSF